MITTKMADSQGLVTTSKNRQSIKSSLFIYGKCMKSCLELYFCHRNFLKPAGKQPTFGDATAGFPTKWCLRNERRNSVRILCYYPDLGSSSDWSCSVENLIKPIRSTTQIWVVTRHQYEISALVS